MDGTEWPDGPAAGRVLATAEGDGLGFEGQGPWRYWHDHEGSALGLSPSPVVLSLRLSQRY